MNYSTIEKNIIDKHSKYDYRNNKIVLTCGICGQTIISYKSLSNNILDEFYNTLKLLDIKISGDTVYCDNCHEQMKRIKTLIDKKITQPKDVTNAVYNRPGKINYYLNIAKEVASRSTCLIRKYGAVLVKDDVIISTGYNGSPRGTKNCNELGYCRREKMKIPRGQNYELCRAVHAEMNCIINSDREHMKESILYLYGIDAKDGNIIDNLSSCQMCKKLIINSGISKVVFARPNDQYEIHDVKDWVKYDETLTNKMGY